MRKWLQILLNSLTNLLHDFMILSRIMLAGLTAIVFGSESDSELFSPFLAKLPPVPTLVTQHKGGHRFVSRPGLDLVVCAVPLLALAALQQVGLGPLHHCKSAAVDTFLHKLLPL